MSVGFIEGSRRVAGVLSRPAPADARAGVVGLPALPASQRVLAGPVMAVVAL